MKEVLKTIIARKSVRNYTDKAIEPVTMKEIQDLLNQDFIGPMGNKVRFKILDFSDRNQEENGKSGTYGLIKGAKMFIAGAMVEKEMAIFDFGYCFEKIVLELTEMGLGTCWMGLSHKSDSSVKKFNDAFELEKGEMIPAVTVFGHFIEKSSIVESIARFALGVNNKKAFDELFFLDKSKGRITDSEAGKYKYSLEAVRLAPSAINKQPWRIFKEAGNNVFHFYQKGGYPVDIGIAMAHFELVALENGLLGDWVRQVRNDIDGMNYTVSWIGK